MSTATKVRQPVARKFVPGRASASHSVKALALYASIVGRQAGVEIVFGDFDTAMTDGKKIFIPTLVNVAEEKWVVILRALIDHEVMHVRQTKFEAVLDCNSPLSKVLCNILEDCWGEREQAKVYPGSLKAIRAGMDELVALRWFAPPPSNAQIDPRAAFVNWLLHDLRGRHFVMSELSAWALQWRSLAEPAFGAQLLDSVLTLMHEVDICKSSAQAVSIANRVVDLLRTQQQDLHRQAQQQRRAKPSPPDGDPASLDERAGDPNEGDDGADSEGSGSCAGGPRGKGQPGKDRRSTETAGAGEQTNGTGPTSDPPDAPNQSGDASPTRSAAASPEGLDANVSSGQGTARGDAGSPPKRAQRATSRAPGDSSADSAGGPQGSKTSSPGGAHAASEDSGADGAGGGASSGADSPEVLERRAGNLESAVNASLQDLPKTEMADAMCSELQGASVMQSAGEHVSGTHARILTSKTSDIPMVANDAAGQEEAEVRELSKSIERRLGAKLRDKLEARTQSSTTYGRRGLRVGSQRLSRARAGALDVFRKTEEGLELSIAVSLVVDMSGSMARVFGATLRRVGAAGAAYAIAEVLGKFAIPFSWVNFGSSARAVKRFADPWRKRRDSQTVDGLGGTELDVPLLRLLPELAARDEERKLFLVITDGDPDNADEVVAVLSLMPMLGVEVAMFFIGSEGAELERKLAAQGIQVARANRPEDLAQGLFEAVDNAFI